MSNIGSREINLDLTVDEITFIVTGLRDLAAGARKRIQMGTDEVELEEDLERENLRLADSLEATYVAQLR
jgi:hypothetical protein